MKWLWKYITVIVVILGIYMYAEYKRPPQIDWRETLNTRDKIPFGTYIIYQELSSFFSEKPTLVREPLYEYINNAEDSGEVYMLIANSINTSGSDEDELLKYIALGNTVFMSSSDLSGRLQDTLNFEVQSYLLSDEFKNDSTDLLLVNPAFEKGNPYHMLKNTVDGHFKSFDTSKATVLGMNNHGKVNFLKMNIGKGSLFIHTAPLAFSNFFMLKDKNVRYVEQVLSYLPKEPLWLYWDEFYSQGREGSATPLRVILTRPALKYAYFVALAAILIYLFFQSKRRQRVIPVINAPGNATVDFVETVARVYYNQMNHRNIALKKLTYLLDYIRSRFGIHTGTLDDTFIEQLSGRSGVSRERVAAITKQIHDLRLAEKISGQELLQFSRETDLFKKEITG